MSLHHNAEADFAAAELARMFVADASLCYALSGPPGALSATASYEPPSSPWPKSDGVISLLESVGNRQRDIALEYKRVQEGAHGLLTAIGQAQGYIHKGYSGAAIVVPSAYSVLSAPAQYVRDVLDRVTNNPAIGVFRYDPPDTSHSSPFAGRLYCVRPFTVNATVVAPRRAAAGPKTQWMHVREGSTTRDAYYRFLQVAKSIGSPPDPEPRIPQPLRDACARLAPGRLPEHLLSSTTNDTLLSRVWRTFWFDWLATSDVLTPWEEVGGTYRVPQATTRIDKDDGTGRSVLWQGRRSSLKAVLVDKLNAGSVTEDQAWEMFAAGVPSTGAGTQGVQGVIARAHSYREDLDSSLAQLGWIDADGRPTDSGYRYASICERYGGANSTAAADYVGATMLKVGHYASFLHYVYRLSEELFSADPLAFTRDGPRGPVFNEESYSEYLAYLQGKLTDELKVMRTVSRRDRPRQRTVLQAELTFLRNYGFVSRSRYRLGVGIPVDWEKVLNSLNLEI